MLKKILLFIMILIGVERVNATELEMVDIDNYYIKYNGIKSDVLMFRNNDTKEALFNISPYENVDASSIRYKYMNYSLFPNIEKELLNDIQDYLYLGYGYKNHDGVEWYLLSQHLLWQTLGYEIDIIDEFDNSILNIYQAEYSEYLDLIADFKVLPSYFTEIIDLNYGENYLLNDTNNVEKQFNLIPYSYIRVEESDNGKYLYGKKPIKSMLALQHTNQPSGYNKVYYSDDSVFINNYTSSKRSYVMGVNIHGGKIKIINIDENNDPIKDAIYMVYNSRDDSVCKLRTDQNGVATTSYLPYDDYYLMEVFMDEQYVSNKDKIKIDFIDYKTNEIMVINKLVKEENNVLIDKNETPDNAEAKDAMNEVGNFNIVEQKPKETKKLELDDNIEFDEIELDVPKTSFDLTKYIIVIIGLLLLIGLKLYAK